MRALFALMTTAVTLPLLLAEATTMDPSMVSLIGQGGVAAVLIWYVVYDVRVRSPAMLATFAKEQSELRETFSKEQSSLRDSHLKVVEMIRQTFASEQALQRQTFATEQSAAREQYHREMGETRNMLFETMKAMRTAVHDVRDTAQSLMGEHGK